MATVLAFGMTGGSHAAQPAVSASWTDGVPSPKARSVTLVTGDRAQVDAQGRVIGVIPGEGREGVPISRKVVGGHTYVLPVDASGLIASGTLDRRLFDVTELVASRYDDTNRGTLPLIVSYTASADAKRTLTAAKVAVTRALPAVDGAALRVPKVSAVHTWNALTDGQAGGRRTLSPGVGAIWLDGVRHATLDRSTAQIGAPQAWQAGWTGKGVRVAVLDTGVDQTHPDLQDAEVAEKNFSDAGDAVDHVGHGTHVASVITGSGAESGGRYKGVAPDAEILDGKVLDDQGSGTDSGILAGIDWAVAEGARVVNMSLGAPDSPGLDPVEQAVNRYSEEDGVLFAIAAGNNGPGAATLDSPGSAAQALTVGAVDDVDATADFSSRGPTVDGTLKPDLAAPGVDIVAAKAAEGYQGDPAADGYVSMSGTSMATPHAAGAAALLAQQHPDWSGLRIKQTLTSSAVNGAKADAYQQGSGRLDVAEAVTQNIVGEQTSLDFGTQRWPHDDDQALVRHLAYRNLSSAPVTLDLAVEATGEGGQSAPADLFTLDTQQVTVPAGGSAQVSITADTSRSMPDGVYGGAVVATAGTQSVRTALVVTREAESYDVTLDFVAPNGTPAAAAASVVGLDNDVFLTPQAADGKVTLRLPRGLYSIEAPLYTDGSLALLVSPELDLTADSTLAFDARKARPVAITPPDHAAPSHTVIIGWHAQQNASAPPVISTWFSESFDDVTTAQVGPSAAHTVFRSHVGGGWDGGDTGYNLVYARDNSFFTGFSHTARLKELARVDVHSGEPAPGKWGTSLALWDDGVVATGLGLARTTLPGATRHYVSPVPGAKWFTSTSQFSGTDQYDGDLIGGLRSVRAGHVYTDTFNIGVFGPSIDETSSRKAGTRYQDSMQLCIPVFSDGQGHRAATFTTSARTIVTADGSTLIDEQTEPCGVVSGLSDRETTYRIKTDLTRDPALSHVTTRVVADWTFSSRRPVRDVEEDLPLSTVRFTPHLTASSTAKPGSALRVPLTVEGAAAGGKLARLSVQVSYDGGDTWRPARVQVGKGMSIVLHHPRDAASVSLRSVVQDKAGNVSRQSIYSAYRLTR
ncbi:S8 family serine peptidase [Streptomyces olivaceoviridis]|uniref:S8 family serine peptidase n=1 Tax=Streptomyces olivaceoviridis TaxID=1921 RepID=UPI00368D4CD1